MKSPLRRRLVFGLPGIGLLPGCLQVAGVGGEGTGNFAGGPIEGFGSIRLAGLKLDEGSVRVTLQVDPRAPLLRSVADIGLRAQVRAQADDGGVLQALQLVPEVVGPLEAVNLVARRVLVLGQTIQLDAVPAEPTLRDGIGDLATLRIGEALIVHGQRNADGVVQASRIGRASADLGLRAAGPVRAVDATRLVIGELSADLQASGFMPADWRPSVGERAIVFGMALRPAMAGQPRQLLAQVVARDDAGIAGAARARLAGTALPGTTPGSWRVAGVPVDFAAIAGAEALVPGQRVEVDGRVDAGVLRAESLRLRDDAAPALALLEGAVSSHAGDGRFSLRGTPVDARGARFVGLGLANLADGVPLRVRALVQGAQVVADEVQLSAPAAGQPYTLAGAVDGWNTGSREFRLIGLPATFVLAADARLEGVSLAQMRDGLVVDVRGAESGSRFVVDTLRLAGAGAPVVLNGLAATVELETDGGFLQVNEVDLVWDGATVFLGPTNSAADLADGRPLRVSARRDAGAPPDAPLRALQIDARPSLPGIFRLRGTVEALVSVADFRVEGQRIDASGATFEPPSLRDSLRGALVDVEGPIDNGILRATRVVDP